MPVRDFVAMSSHSGVDRQGILEVKELCPASQSGRLTPRNVGVVNPKGVADADYDRRMLQHRREDRDCAHGMASRDARPHPDSRTERESIYRTRVHRVRNAFNRWRIAAI